MLPTNVPCLIAFNGNGSHNLEILENPQTIPKPSRIIFNSRQSLELLWSSGLSHPHSFHILVTAQLYPLLHHHPWRHTARFHPSRRPPWHLLLEWEKSNYEIKRLVTFGLVRLPIAMGRGGLRRYRCPPSATGQGLETGHCSLQQVSTLIRNQQSVNMQKKKRKDKKELQIGL